jgi:uncharacterized membrane protein
MTNETGRIEAFSHGVFAVAITLLVLDIEVPPASSWVQSPAVRNSEGGGAL